MSSIIKVKLSPLLDLSCEYYPDLFKTGGVNIVPDEVFACKQLRSSYYKVGAVDAACIYCKFLDGAWLIIGAERDLSHPR